MKNTFGNNITFTLFGESHGTAIGVVIDGISPGLVVDEEYIAEKLARRRPSSAIDTARRETDKFVILSGVFEGKTTGTPIAIVIPNEDTHSADYGKTHGIARPSHADFAAHCKYHGFEDWRGGGHFSGRITAALVAAGAIVMHALEDLGISVGAHILSCGKAYDRHFDDVADDVASLRGAAFPVLDERSREMIEREIISAKEAETSVGGVVQAAIVGVPAGVGEPWFDSVEGMLSHALFSLGGVKGVEFGLGFAFADVRGDECNDAFRVENGAIVTETNNNGGINGGITNGMPIVFSCAVKPTPSISREQKTVNYLTNENTTLSIVGRHDPAIVRRICPVIESASAIVIADMLAGRFGTDVLTRGITL